VEQPMERIRVLIVDDIAETRENLRKLLSFDASIEVIGAAASGQEGIKLAKEFHPHIVLMDINMPGMDGITATEAVLQELPATQVVMLSVQGETDYLRRAMLAGARDFLTKPPTGDELMGTIRRVYETGKTRAAMMMPMQPTAPTATTTEGRRARHEGKVIAVFSPKGGVGCTTIAVNLAVALQDMLGSKQKVALMDASVQFGDVGVMLRLKATRSLADLVPHVEDLDRDMLNSALSTHTSGLKVLLAPPHPEAADSLLASTADGGHGGGAALGTILTMMREEFDVIVVDMWSWLDDIALTIFDAAALIVLVVMPSIPAIKSARLFLEVATTGLNYPMEKIALVVNGVDRRVGIPVDKIEQAMMPAAAQIPLDQQVVMTAVNMGEPFVTRDPSRPVSQGIMRLAERVQSLVTEEREE